MNFKKLHIISFDVPFPPDYGGVIDVYYKIKSLRDAGVEIILHTYQYGRGKATELERICQKVYYYPRKILKNPFTGSLPYIIKTRSSGQLLENLLQDEYPVFFEGLHSCYYLGHPRLSSRTKIVRMHNLESLYYKHLAKVESNPVKRYFFHLESQRLQNFQSALKYANKIALISPGEYEYLKLKYNNCFYLPVYHPNQRITISSTSEDFCFYHGNLGVPENNEAALYLAGEIFNGFDKKLVIAGMNPSKKLIKTISGNPQVQLLINTNSRAIMDLISKARINILPTFQNTGIKIKLLNVLYRGKHCLVTPRMVEGTGLESLCHIAGTNDKIRRKINELHEIKFDNAQIQTRKKILDQQFDKQKNTQKLIREIFR